MPAESMTRRDAILNLLELRHPVQEAAAVLAGFPWDSNEELVVLSFHDLGRVNYAFRAGLLQEADLVMWAEALSGREDIGMSNDAEPLTEFLFELSTAELFGGVDQVVSDVSVWLRARESEERKT